MAGRGEIRHVGGARFEDAGAGYGMSHGLGVAWPDTSKRKGTARHGLNWRDLGRSFWAGGAGAVERLAGLVDKARRGWRGPERGAIWQVRMARCGKKRLAETRHVEMAWEELTGRA